MMKRLRKENTNMKLFISQPMSGKTIEQVEEMRALAIKTVMAKYPDEKFEIINNYVHEDAPSDASRLWHLGRSIQQLAEADVITFTPDWRSANGCLVERVIADLYDIKVI